MHAFMDHNPPSLDPKEASRKKSTLFRWKDQVSECTLHWLTYHTTRIRITSNCISRQCRQHALTAQCTLIKRLSDDIFIIYEHVPVSYHMKEAVTRVHIVSLEGFLWKDCPENIVPTCCCSSNRNVKDCCAGIMFALQHRTEFKGWFDKCFTEKRELLSRRLRADCDPVLYTVPCLFVFHFTLPPPRQFIDIAQIRSQPLPRAVLQQRGDAPAKEEPPVVTGAEVRSKISLLDRLVVEVGSDQFLVSRDHFSS